MYEASDFKSVFHPTFREMKNRQELYCPGSDADVRRDLSAICSRNWLSSLVSPCHRLQLVPAGNCSQTRLRHQNKLGRTRGGALLQWRNIWRNYRHVVTRTEEKGNEYKTLTEENGRINEDRRLGIEKLVCHIKNLKGNTSRTNQ